MENSYSICKNIKSKKDTKTRCANTATHGDFCWLHYKRPNMWIPEGMIVPSTSTKLVKGTSQPTSLPVLKITTRAMKANKRLDATKSIQRWFRSHKAMHQWRRRGPAVFVRSLCVNEVDFFSTDPVADISGIMFFSYMDEKKHVYGFDLRSIASLIEKSDDSEKVENPFNRALLPASSLNNVHTLVRQLVRANISTKWEPLKPETPIQQYRMKVVDLFALIDQLNYYTSPDWFLALTDRGHKTFYRELYSIWTIRANLTSTQKRQIVPNYLQTLFRYPPWALVSMSLEKIQSINLGTIRTFITSATDKNDRILGAMYVMSALTLVSPEARNAYSWLYESVITDDNNHLMMLDNEPHNQPRGWGMTGWLTDLLQLMPSPIATPPNQVLQPIPHLLLPPPANTEEQPADEN